MPIPESSTKKRIPEPDQVSHFRKHASYLLVGRVADRFFDAGWFLLGLGANLIVVMPYLIVLALLLGRFHFSVIKYWYLAVLIGAMVVFVPILFVTQLQVSRLSSGKTIARFSRLFGGMILAFGISAILTMSCLTVEYFRDVFRFNDVSLLSAISGSGALFGALGLLQRNIPGKLRGNSFFLTLLGTFLGALAVFMILVLLINWIVYGNTLEVASFFKHLNGWSYGQLAILAFVFSCLFISLAWLRRNLSIIAWIKNGRTAVLQSVFGNGNILSKHNLLYLLPLLVTCLIVFPYRKTTEKIEKDAREISFGIGLFSRSLNVFASINPSDNLNFSVDTKRTIDYLRTQRNGIRWRQEYVPTPEEGGLDTFGRFHVRTFGVVQSYVDNAAELNGLDESQKFLLRQTIAELSRKLLLQRANIALGQTGRDLTSANRWALVKPILVEQTALRFLTQSSDFFLNPTETLDEAEKRLVSRLIDAKVNSLYQREFIDLFCPDYANRVPMPARETSSFPGTIPVFFDGIDPKDKFFVLRAIGRSLLRNNSESDPRVVAFKALQDKLVLQIVAGEDIRKSINESTDAELFEMCLSEPALVSELEDATKKNEELDERNRPNLRFKEDVPFTDLMPVNLGASRCSIPEQLGIYAASSNLELKTTTGDVARELLIEKSFSVGSQSVDSLQRLQAPEILFSDDAAMQRTKYARRGKEQFAPRDLIRVAIAPFIGEGIAPSINSQVAECKQIDVVASTVAYSDFANLEKLANTRYELFSQNFGLKGALISLVALLFGSFSAGWINVNRTTANEYYRAKLKQAFLTDIDGKSLDVKMSDLNCPESRAPYLLINTVANLQGSDDLSLRDCKCDMFLLSPLHVGSRRTGYMNVQYLEKADPSFQLSNAVAISAAAIGPNMGRFTSPLLVWLLSLLNIRLGYWVPNPRHLTQHSDVSQREVKDREIIEYLRKRRGIVPGTNPDLELIGLAFPGGGIRSATFNLGIAQAFSERNLFSAYDYLSTVSGGGYIGSSLVAQLIRSYRDCNKPASVEKSIQTERVSGRHWYPPPALLIKEMLSKLTEKDAWLNLSDGGHVENLAVFELLERECKLIVVGNAEAGTTNPNNGLGILIRMAKTDLGIDIVLNTNGFHLNEHRYSRTHWAVGRILYPSGTEGKLVVLRASMTGDESVAITEYKERCSMFPFESTTDQFFDVDQFEAYRLLGEHIAKDFLTAIFPDSFPSEEESISSRCQLLREAVNNICPEQARFQEVVPVKKGELHG